VTRTPLLLLIVATIYCVKSCDWRATLGNHFANLPDVENYPDFAKFSEVSDPSDR
jgi:hypothetical protein